MQHRTGQNIKGGHLKSVNYLAITNYCPMIPVMLSIRSQKNITFQTVELDWTKLEVIRSYLSASYGWTAGDYTMSYVDSDGDEVTVEAQQDLNIAAELSKDMKGINIIVDIGILPIPFMTRQQLEEINKQSKSDQPNIDVNKSCPKESDNLSEVEGIMPAKKPQKNHRDKKQKVHHPKAKQELRWVTKEEVLELINIEFSRRLNSKTEMMMENAHNRSEDTIELAGYFCNICESGLTIPYYLNPKSMQKICQKCESCLPNEDFLVKVRSEITALEISRIYCLPIFRDDTIHQEEADKLAFLHELKEVACKKCKEMIVQETQRAKQEIKINQTKRELKVKEEKIKQGKIKQGKAKNENQKTKNSSKIQTVLDL